MSHDDVSGVPDLIRQQQLTEELARLVVRAAGEGWDLVRYTVRAVVPYYQDELDYRRHDGSVAKARVPDETLPLVDELRQVMYRTGAGTWFSARISVDGQHRMSADFDYDDEPDWEWPVEPGWYVQDLQQFPRDPGAIPPWLRRQLNAAADESDEPNGDTGTGA